MKEHAESLCWKLKVGLVRLVGGMAGRVVGTGRKVVGMIAGMVVAGIGIVAGKKAGGIDPAVAHSVVVVVGVVLLIVLVVGCTALAIGCAHLEGVSSEKRVQEGRIANIAVGHLVVVSAAGNCCRGHHCLRRRHCSILLGLLACCIICIWYICIYICIYLYIGLNNNDSVLQCLPASGSVRNGPSDRCSRRCSTGASARVPGVEWGCRSWFPFFLGKLRPACWLQ